MHTKAGGLSGGLKRRLKLALELLADRKIFFLGEFLEHLICEYSTRPNRRRIEVNPPLLVSFPVVPKYGHVVASSTGPTAAS